MRADRFGPQIPQAPRNYTPCAETRLRSRWIIQNSLPKHRCESMPSASKILFRAGYRLAFLALRLWWFIRRPDLRGCQVALWAAGHVLLVRTSYRREYAFPGGLVKRREDPVVAASRELAEETDILAPPEKLEHTMSVIEHREFCGHLNTICSVWLDQAPTVRINPGEIVEAIFVEPEDALQLPISRCARLYMLWAMREGHRRTAGSVPERPAVNRSR